VSIRSKICVAGCVLALTAVTFARFFLPVLDLHRAVVALTEPGRMVARAAPGDRLPMPVAVTVGDDRSVSLYFENGHHFSRAAYEEVFAYFFAALAADPSSWWVNLSPDEPDRVIGKALDGTALGDVFLAQDHLLKQRASALTDPRTLSGRDYWAMPGARDSTMKVWIEPSAVRVASMLQGCAIEEAGLTVRGEKVLPPAIMNSLHDEVTAGSAFSSVRAAFRACVLASYAVSSGLVKGTRSREALVMQPGAGIVGFDRTVFRSYRKSLDLGAYRVSGQVSPSSVRTYAAGGVGLVGIPVMTKTDQHADGVDLSEYRKVSASFSPVHDDVSSAIGTPAGEGPIRNFHMHSNFSDGYYFPEKLMRKASEQGVKEISLTDHDTIEGLARARTAALELGMDFVNGIELTTMFYNLTKQEHQAIHLLAYGFSEERFRGEKKLLNYFDAVRKRDLRWAYRTCAKSKEDPLWVTLPGGRELPFTVDNEDIEQFGGTIYTQYHHAIVLAMKLHAASQEFSEPDLAIPARILYYVLFTSKYAFADDQHWGQVFAKYRIDMRRRWDVGFNSRWQHTMPIHLLAPIVLDAGGILVAAHPGKYAFTFRELNDLQELGVRGIETDAYRHSVMQKNFLKHSASRLDLFRIHGTDFHDPFKKARDRFIPLGLDHDGSPMKKGAALADLDAMGATVYRAPKKSASSAVDGDLGGIDLRAAGVVAAFETAQTDIVHGYHFVLLKT